jgi:hypothetical protein
VLRNAHLLHPFHLGIRPFTYKAGRQGGAHKRSAGKAIVDVFNVINILQGFAFMF